MLHINVQKFGTDSFFLKNKTIIQQGSIKLIKSNSKDIYNVPKDFYFK